MRLLNVNSVEELKSFGKFRDLREEIKEELGKNKKKVGVVGMIYM